MAPGTYLMSRFSQIFGYIDVFFSCYSITIFMDAILGELYFVYVIAYFVDINYKYLCFFFIFKGVIRIDDIPNTTFGLMERFSDQRQLSFVDA